MRRAVGSDAGVCEEGRDRSLSGKLRLKPRDVVRNEGCVSAYGDTGIVKRVGAGVALECAR